MTTKMAITHRGALNILANSGLVNELNAQAIFDRLVKDVKQPTKGYFYINDVYDFGEVLLKELVENE